MNIRQIIMRDILARGCTIAEHNGIWYITEPNGNVWDMTVPARR